MRYLRNPAAPNLVARPLARLVTFASLVPAMGPWRTLAHRRLLLRQAPDRVERVYESIWRDAANELGVEMNSPELGTFAFSAGRRSTTVWNHTTTLDTDQAVANALDKPLVNRRLAELGLPVPEHLEFSIHDPRAAFRFLSQHGGPCVLKPAARSGGLGVTCGIRTPLDLTRALLAALPFGSRVMFERQVDGDVYRLLFLDGVLLDVLRRAPSHVSGDGRSTVLALIEAENHRRVRARGNAGFHLIRPDLDCVLALRSAGLRPRSVPDVGQSVAVKSSCGDGGAADTFTIEPLPAPELVEEAAVAAGAVGARLAGVEVVTRDPERSLASSGGAIIEVNVPPGLHYHYLVSAPERARRVAVPVLQTLLKLHTKSG
jgi:D-alanine-D-alanine ligase-like ATP-grasp enzyme